MALRAFVLAALALAVLVPAASAHTSVYSADHRVRAVVGLLNEPVSTYAVSGLDVCFTEDSAARAALTTVNPGNLTATLWSPGNASSLALPLAGQFGRAGCFTFQSHPFVPTQPGQYWVTLKGNLNGTTIDVSGVKAGGEVKDRADLTFPDGQVPNQLDLQARIVDLEQKLAALEAEHEDDHKAPSPVAPILMVGLAALAAVARRLK